MCSVIHNIVDGNKLCLSKCVRSDKKLFDLSLQALKNKNMIPVLAFPQKELTKLNLSFTHMTRKIVNKKCNEKFSQGKDKIFFKSNDNIKTQSGFIYVGCPIISYKNNKKYDIYNNQTFDITRIDKKKKTFYIMIEGKEEEFKVSEFSNQFLLAFCITIHCSQGQTYSEKYTIYDWNHPRFNKKLAYVALSRSTKYEYIQINEREFRE